MILVTGATGNCGRTLVPELKAQNTPIRVLVRSADKGQEFEEQGIDVAVGDFTNVASIEAALDGVDTLFLLSSQHPDQAKLQGNVVDAAKKAGVTRIVKVSGGTTVAQKDSVSFIGRQHWETEQQITDTGLSYTFLRPSWYMQNLLQVAQPVRESGTLPSPFFAPGQRIAAVDVRDVGLAAAKVLAENGRHAGKIYELTGPESLTGDEVAARFGRVLGKEVRHVDPPIDTVMEGLQARGAPDWLQQHLREIATIMRDGGGAEVTDTAEKLLGRPARTIDQFIRDNSAAFS